MRLATLGALLAMAALIAPVVAAQSTAAKVLGTVRDESGAVLPGVTVTATNAETRLARTTTTDGSGRYSLSGLPPGSYELRTELSGFQIDVRAGLSLTVGQEAVLDFVMKVGELTEELTVTGAAPLVNTTTGGVSGLVDDRQIRELPLNGRSFAELALLQTGVSRFSNTTVGPIGGRGIKMTVAGARISSNSFLLDGTDINDGYNNTPGSVAGVLLGVETVREFRVNTSSYSAEYGRSGGAVINAVTKSGTNQLRGGGWEFFRNSALDAKNFFDPPGRPIPPFTRNQFGFTLGGPIKKDRTFFFGGYEGLRERLSLSQVATVPNRDARNGILPGGQVVQVNQTIRPYLDLYPLPNGRDFGDGTAEVLFSQRQPTDEDFFVTKIDHTFSDRDSLLVRYTFDDGSVPRPLDFPIFVSAEDSRNQYVTVEEKRIFSSRLLNTFRFGFNRSRSDANFALIEPGAASLPEAIPGRGRIPDLISQFGLSPFPHDDSRPFPALNRLNLFEFSNDVNFDLGRHALKFGGIVKNFHYDITQGFRMEGTFAFSSLRDFLEARPFNFVGTSPDSDPLRNWRQKLFGFYVQDNYRWRDNLTLNLGLRYEFQTVPTEVNGKIWNLRNPLDTQTTQGDPFFKNPSLKNFAPRVGFAWDASGDQKTALRGGFGIFHDQMSVPFYLTTSFQTPLFTINVVPRPPFPRPFEGGTVVRVPVLQPIEFDTLRTPYRMQYNLTLEREIMSNTTVSVGYVGSLGRHLGRVRDVNAVNPDILPDGRPSFPAGRPRPNRTFGSIAIKSTDANSAYDSLQLGLVRRFDEGLRFQISYTWSKCLDDSSVLLRNDADNSGQLALDKDRRTLDRGLCSFDLRHNFTSNFSYELPFGRELTGLAAHIAKGWQLSGIVTLNSGNPFTVINGFDQSRSKPGEVATDRPNLRAGATNNPVLGDPAQYFDPRAFELQAPGFYGNLGRNTLIGPGLATVDALLVKTFDVAPGKVVQFRAEMFNLFNRPNFEAPNQRARTVFVDGQGRVNGSAGRLTRTVTTSRQIQFGLKVLF